MAVDGIVAIATALGRRWPVVLAAGLALAGTPPSSSPMRAATAADGPGGGSPAPVRAMVDGVVDITGHVGDTGTIAAGTGMVVTPQGAVLTNNHVIRGARRIRVTVPGGRRYRARVLGADADQDVALLQVLGAPALTPATFGDSSTVAVGDAVTAVGNAGGVGGAPSVSAGTVTQLHRSITVTDENGLEPEHLHDLIETDARIEPGDSGGPLIDAGGQVIGMDTAAAGDPPGPQATPDGFAIPIDGALAVVHAIQDGGGSAPAVARRSSHAPHSS
ncbi:MAG TPA: trypsin-like peptidase domain-containing protein [Baekduia sp.]|uniref:S1C family serine protease n=1 Tax=Baekduia sp. TaxID=2600305 RepID=UPI002C9C3F1A|nr:trypsin-like peptidase domain-containing protein [Baekduia sp.]HMJ34291.1 trypsin-like peptidase domain-containing protein [Baekduia sp.]